MPIVGTLKRLEYALDALKQKDSSILVDGVTSDRSMTARLTDETPSAPLGEVAYVRGVLDTLMASTMTILLRLENGRVLRGCAAAVPLDRLKQFLGADVSMEGLIEFGPSGDPVYIDAEAVFAAKASDRPSTDLPAVEPHTSAAGLDAWFGTWPGDETDVELSDAMRRTG